MILLSPFLMKRTIFLNFLLSKKIITQKKKKSNLQRGTVASSEPAMQSLKVGETKMSLSFLSPWNPVANMTKSVFRGCASPLTKTPSLQKLKLLLFFKLMLPSSTLSQNFSGTVAIKQELISVWKLCFGTIPNFASLSLFSIWLSTNLENAHFCYTIKTL